MLRPSSETAEMAWASSLILGVWDRASLPKRLEISLVVSSSKIFPRPPLSFLKLASELAKTWLLQPGFPAKVITRAFTFCATLSLSPWDLACSTVAPWRACETWIGLTSPPLVLMHPTNSSSSLGIPSAILAPTFLRLLSRDSAHISPPTCHVFTLDSSSQYLSMIALVSSPLRSRPSFAAPTRHWEIWRFWASAREPRKLDSTSFRTSPLGETRILARLPRTLPVSLGAAWASLP
mmetsp:Transcript_769/g.2375  ORF Transcript_769/g.2375 Transcript_769/m.2375 type:complete len:236 (-) Transcript_769:1509-2216(-)